MVWSFSSPNDRIIGDRGLRCFCYRSNQQRFRTNDVLRTVRLRDHAARLSRLLLFPSVVAADPSDFVPSSPTLPIPPPPLRLSVRPGLTPVFRLSGELHYRVHVIRLDEELPEADARLQEEDGDRLLASVVPPGVVGAQVRTGPAGALAS